MYTNQYKISWKQTPTIIIDNSSFLFCKKLIHSTNLQITFIDALIDDLMSVIETI